MSDYWDEELNTDDGYAASPGAGDQFPTMAMPDSSEISESLQIAFGGGPDSTGGAETSTWWRDIFTAPSPTEDRLNTDVQSGKGAAAPGAQPKQEEKGLIGRITDFANQNKSLTEMVLKGVAGAATAKNASKAATAQMREKDQIERERNAQYSASIAALAKPGIIGRAQPLKRTNGTQVFNNGRIA